MRARGQISRTSKSIPESTRQSWCGVYVSEGICARMGEPMLEMHRSWRPSCLTRGLSEFNGTILARRLWSIAFRYSRRGTSRSPTTLRNAWTRSTGDLMSRSTSTMTTSTTSFRSDAWSLWEKSSCESGSLAPHFVAVRKRSGLSPRASIAQGSGRLL